MNILSIEGLSLAFGSRVILHDVSAAADERDRIGVLGINGAGKSTLLALIAGRLEPDSGEIITRRGLRIAYLSQDPAFDEEKSILENVAAAITGKAAHWDTEGEAKALLERFGIPDASVLPKVLSGGQRKRAALAAAMLTPCDLLILDEPTNHLDHAMIEYLQDWLASFPGTLLMVTHDRYFLDEVTDRIWELDRAELYRYAGNYSSYLQKKQERMDFARAAERKMAALYKQDLAWIQRGARARSTKQKAHIRRFEALRDREQLIEERTAALSSMASRLGKKILELEGLGKNYGSRVIFRDFTYMFTCTDRIGIIGPNGCGKTTLLRCLLGELELDCGTREVGTTVRFGYFGQTNLSLPENERVIDAVKDVADFVRTEDGLISAAMMCERFLFDSEMQYTVISKLSGGEKRRLYLLKVLMSAPNVLILDEPTNDLDIPTLQVLENYLDRFNGVIIAVSHDRYFLDRVVSRIFAFGPDGRLLRSEGAYTEYLEHMAAEAQPEQSEKCAAQKTAAEPKAARKMPRVPKKLSYAEQREYDTIESIIDELTAKAAELDAQLAEGGSDYIRLQQLTEEKEQADKALEEKLARYLELEEKIEALAEAGRE